MKLYPFLAAFWLVFSVGILLMPDTPPGARFGIAPALRPALAALAATLAAYNIVRWRLTRAVAVQRRREEPRDASFDFVDEPQPPP